MPVTKRVKRKDRIYKKPSINSDSFDVRRFHQLYTASQGMKDVREKGKDLPMFDNLIGDVWSSFYKSSPELLPDDKQSPDVQSNAEMVGNMLNDDSFQSVHENTQFDDLMSGLSTINYSGKIFEWIDERRKENEEMDDAMNQAQDKKEEHGEDSDEFQQAMEGVSSAIQQEVDHTGGELSKMLQQAQEEAKKQKKDVEELLGGIQSGTADSALKEVPLREQFNLAEQLKSNKQMKEVAKWAGRFKRIAKSKQKSISKQSISKSGITTGNEIDRLLPSELLNYAIPEAKADFLRRFTEGQTLQHDSKGKESLGRGPIILCLDQSGSMDYLDQQSKGFLLALMSIAKFQKRDFAYIPFSIKARPYKEYPKGKITPSEMTRIATEFMGGGTNFVYPLRESLKAIQKNRFKNADIIFVTDGNDNMKNSFLQEFQDRKKKDGFSVISLLIGPHASRQTVSQFSDRVHHAKNFAENDAHEVFDF
ncbi:hypothetical protein H0266_18515 [Halobacillus locisalis]|uniref:VWFA domain-containing protein n=1 Tax=Halobacillus locisalis TaxID=220753 RepID=A0A838CXW5_9BACI|nr:hypothetical protein [Halobacillus locisalis]MBA2176877.1 hypothetical protein [Halobacillus locisalis]